MSDEILNMLKEIHSEVQSMKGRIDSLESNKEVEKPKKKPSVNNGQRENLFDSMQFTESENRRINRELERVKDTGAIISNEREQEMKRNALCMQCSQNVLVNAYEVNENGQYYCADGMAGICTRRG